MTSSTSSFGDRGDHCAHCQVWARHSLLELGVGPLKAGPLRMGDEMSVLLTEEKGVGTS